MKKALIKILFSPLLILLVTISASAFQSTAITTPEAASIIGEATTTPQPTPTMTSTPYATVINPLTGLPVADPDRLAYAPVFIPITRFPSGYRPSYGNGQAAWTFEMYVNNEESRPVLMFYGDMPKSTVDGIDPMVSHLSSALFGLESLRLQYHGIIIAGGTSKSILNAGIMNMEFWYGLSGAERYPSLPLEKMQRIMDKWQKLISPSDPNNMALKFSETAPDGGVSAKSLYMHYADVNKILWEYDEGTKKWLRSQNSNEIKDTLAADVDTLTGQQVATDNLIILQAHHEFVGDLPKELGFFTVILNYVEKEPAIIYRDGKMYNVYWTTKSEAFEKESDRMRPIRFINEDGSRFPLKPGQTWVHITMPGNPLYEVDEALGSSLSAGSGHWKLPYISFKPGAEEEVLAEVPELKDVEYAITN